MIVDLSKRWMNDDVPCLRREPELFFTDHGSETLLHPGDKVQARWNRAKKVCANCPVIKQCARDNLGEIDGVWGGLDPAQRIRLRKTHAQSVRNLTGELKEEYAELAYRLRKQRKLPWPDVGRIMGFDFKTAEYLYTWWETHLRELESEKEIADLELPKEVAPVMEINVNAEYPDKSPSQGDGWVRYGRRVVWGYYLGQTEDDAWYYMKIKLLAQEYSVCWIKVEDVQLTRPVARNILTRVGNGSRIYGTALSRRRTSQAG